MSDEATSPAPASNGLAGFVLENRSWMHVASLLMIVYAVWAVIEVFSNTWFHDLQPLTVFETGSETNINPNDLQRNNSGMIIASGAVFGLFGLFTQYVYRGAPMVDSSMAAAAAMILDQATADRVSQEDIITKAEEAATVAAAEVAKETAEDTVIEMLDPDAGEEEAEEEAEEESTEEEAEEEAEPEEEEEEAEEAEEESTEEEAEEEAEPEEEEEEAPPEEKKKF
jgi:flagellar biosynthesis GTPase FlhF